MKTKRKKVINLLTARNYNEWDNTKSCMFRIQTNTFSSVYCNYHHSMHFLLVKVICYLHVIGFSNLADLWVITYYPLHMNRARNTDVAVRTCENCFSLYSQNNEIIKHDRHILAEIHKVRKGMWAFFFLDCAFRMLIGCGGKLQSHGSYFTKLIGSGFLGSKWLLHFGGW